MSRRDRSGAWTAWRIALAIVAVAVVIAAWARFGWTERIEAFANRLLLKQDDVIVERRPDASYEKLFPTYVEICSVSQFETVEGQRGNPFGHAVMYLKGACKDETAPFPQLRRCRHAAADTADPEHGAGVSVGRFFRNVNWVAVPGYDFFFSGGLSPDERVTQERLDAAVQTAIDKGVFDGVELHRNWGGPADAPLSAFVARRSIGTDFALQFSRNVFCARSPVSEPALDEIIAFLNDKNQEYANGEADYNWALLSHNCVHTLRNALASANFWEPISVRQVKLRALFNLAVPSNEFVNLAQLGAEGPLAFDEVADVEAARDSLHDFHWLPTRHGAVVKVLPIHPLNDLYRTNFRLFVVQSPLLMGRTADAVRLLSDPSRVDLRANLLDYRARYDELLRANEGRLEGAPAVRGDPDRRAGRLYIDYLLEQRAEVDALLAKLDEIESPTKGAPR